MELKSVYLCGPVTGRPEGEALKHFTRIEEKIRNAAKENNVKIHTMNPMRFCTPDDDWATAMRRCVGTLCWSDGIAVLEGWQNSRGAALEMKLARELRIPVVYVEPPENPIFLPELFAAAPEAERYYDACLLQFFHEGTDDVIAAARSEVELFNRYLDPHGFEHINEEEKEHGNNTSKEKR